MARIAVGGFQHETNTFSEQLASLDDFLTGGGWPGMLEGQAVVDVTAAMNLPVAGAIKELQRQGHEIVPLLWAAATPSGRVEHDAYNHITARTLDVLLQAGEIDGIYLDLHGAMATTLCDDGEGAFLRVLRNVVGNELPVVASLDLHANVSQCMFDLSDALVGYRTYPHVDMDKSGERAVRLLLGMLRHGRKYAKSMARLNFLVPMTGQSTLSDPSARLYASMELIEQDGGLDSLTWTGGFALADVPDAGQTILAYAWDQVAADSAVARLAEEISAAENQFENTVWDEREAVAWALAHADVSRGPVILADTQDNPGGGGASDTTGLLQCLVEADAQNAVVAMIRDPAAVQAAHAAGAGREIELALGGRETGPDGTSGVPFHGRFYIECLTDGRFTGTGPMWGGSPIDLGAAALLRIGGVRVMVVSNKMQAADQSLLRHVGIEPCSVAILVLKSSVHFRADFQELAQRILVVASPGLVTAKLSALDYRNLRPGMRVAGKAITNNDHERVFM